MAQPHYSVFCYIFLHCRPVDEIFILYNILIVTLMEIGVRLLKL